MQARSKLTVKDLDELATGQAVQEAIASLLGENAATDVVMVKQSRGQQLAIVTGSASTIEGILAKGRLRVGYVLCRTRAWRVIKRCFRCHGLGHFSKECTNPDRSGCCRRCGETGHLANECKNPPRNIVSQERVRRYHIHNAIT